MYLKSSQGGEPDRSPFKSRGKSWQEARSVTQDPLFTFKFDIYSFNHPFSTKILKVPQPDRDHEDQRPKTRYGTSSTSSRYPRRRFDTPPRVKG
jgi:hypothetical protein